MGAIALCKLEDCSPEVRADLNEIAESLGTTFPGELFEALACHPQFLSAIKDEVRRIAESPEFEHAGVLLRGDVLEEERKLGIPREAIHRNLMQSGIPLEAISQLGHEMASFHYGNPKLLLLAEIINMSLSGQWPVSRSMPELQNTMALQRPMHRTGMTLIPSADASDEVCGMYDRICNFNEGIVPREYQAIAKHPDYLKLSLSMIEPLVPSKGYHLHCDMVSEKAKPLAQNWVDSEAFLSALELCPDSEQEEIRSLIQRCCDWLPKHCLNVCVLWDNIAQEKRLLDVERMAA